MYGFLCVYIQRTCLAFPNLLKYVCKWNTSCYSFGVGILIYYSIWFVRMYNICMYVCMYVCMYICMYVCMYVYMYVCIYVCMYICMYVCMYICMYVYMYVCIYVCAQINIQHYIIICSLCTHTYVCTVYVNTLL